ncbi:GDSL-type esterase/lipase family protein [Amphibacillus jilinensis]|uniref:GDSL-type esterase/lipase family protein n=1 Tax=Amphibacillus jilinensis TaxID=1216008 RepID=UPI0002E56B77|nr:GDSL-type esterase/lipase family protein [Amphibacillus jilinensis]
MTRRKKMTLISLVLIFLIVGGFLFFIIRPTSSNQTTQTEPDSENIDQVLEQVENMDEEVATATNDLSQNLRDAVEQTLGVFTQHDYHITAVGDSLTQGVGDETNNDGYIGILEHRLNDLNYQVNIDNYGRRGNRTDQLLTRLEEENGLKRSIQRADLILVTIGANDIMRIVRENFLDLNEGVFDLELDDYQQRLTDVFEMIHAYNDEAEIYLIGFFNPFEGYFDDVEALDSILTEWNETGKTIVEDYPNGHFIPIEDLFQINEVNLLADDNFHPNGTGYSLMASRILFAIIPALEDIAEEREEETAEQGISLE